MQSPDTRHAIPGTVPPPIAGWQTRFDLNSGDSPGLRDPFTVTVSHPDGTPANGVHLWLETPGMPHLEEGNTDASGQLLIVGAHRGDVVQGAGSLPVADVVSRNAIALDSVSAMHGPLQQNGAQAVMTISDKSPALNVFGALDPSGAVIVTANLKNATSQIEPSIIAFFENGKSQQLAGKFDPSSETYSAILENPKSNAIVQFSASQKLDDGSMAYGSSALALNGIAGPVQTEIYSPDGAFAFGHPGKAISEGTQVCVSEGADMGEVTGLTAPIALSFDKGNIAPFVIKFLLSGDAATQAAGPNGPRMVILRRTREGKVVALKSVMHKDLKVIAAETDQPGTFTVSLGK